MDVNIHFHEEVDQHRAAEALLIDKPAGAYVTWRSDEKHYYITYNSTPSCSKHHIDIIRDVDGTFQLVHSANTSGKFNNLGEVISSRMYLTPDTSFSSSILSTPSTEGLRKRAAVNTGGAPDLPSTILPPKSTVEKKDEDDEFWQPGIPATFSIPTFNKIFKFINATVAVLGLFLTYAYIQLHDDVLRHFGRVNSVVQEAIDSSMKSLYGTLRSSISASPNTCGAAAEAWLADMSRAANIAQDHFEIGSGPEYIGWLFLVIGICFLMCLFLLLVHTGREDEHVEFLRRGGKARTKQLWNPMQKKWSLSFLSSLTLFIITGTLLFNVLWEGGDAAALISNAAKVLSNEYPIQKITSTAVINVKDLSSDELDQYTWRRGFWGVIVPHLGVTEECLAETAQIVKDHSLTYSPAALRIPLMRLIPSFYHPSNEEFREHHTDRSCFFEIDDPLSKSFFFHGIFDFPAGKSWNYASMLVPSHAGVSQLTVGIISISVILYFMIIAFYESFIIDVLPRIKTLISSLTFGYLFKDSKELWEAAQAGARSVEGISLPSSAKSKLA